MAATPPPLQPVELTLTPFGVIDAARQRQRRRRLRLSVALTLALLVAVAVAGLRGAVQHSSGLISNSPLGPPLVAPAAVLSRSPYMGVHCPQPNAISCDRIGLAIWLRRPAISVDATVAGQPLKLDWLGEEPRFASTKPRTEFAGYLKPAGLTTRLHVKPTEGPSFDPVCDCRVGPTWVSSPRDHPDPLVRLEIRYADRARVITQLRVYLGSGWG